MVKVRNDVANGKKVNGKPFAVDTVTTIVATFKSFFGYLADSHRWLPRRGFDRVLKVDRATLNSKNEDDDDKKASVGDDDVEGANSVGPQARRSFAPCPEELKPCQTFGSPYVTAFVPVHTPVVSVAGRFGVSPKTAYKGLKLFDANPDPPFGVARSLTQTGSFAAANQR